MDIDELQPPLETLTLTTWEVAECSEPFAAKRGGRCILTGRGFRTGSSVRLLTLDSGVSGFFWRDGSFGIAVGRGRTWWTTATFDLGVVPGLLSNPALGSITLFTRDGTPATFTERQADGSWLWMMSRRWSAQAFQKKLRRAFAVSASRVGGRSWGEYAAMTNDVRAALASSMA